MTDREALAAALETGTAFGWRTHREFAPLMQAGDERLAQLPDLCDSCFGGTLSTGPYFEEIIVCPICHGSGKVYRPELASTVKRGLLSVAGEVASDGSFWCPDIAQAVVAVLDALNGETP